MAAGCWVRASRVFAPHVFLYSLLSYQVRVKFLLRNARSGKGGEVNKRARENLRFPEVWPHPAGHKSLRGGGRCAQIPTCDHSQALIMLVCISLQILLTVLAGHFALLSLPNTHFSLALPIYVLLPSSPRARCHAGTSLVATLAFVRFCCGHASLPPFLLLHAIFLLRQRGKARLRATGFTQAALTQHLRPGGTLAIQTFPPSASHAEGRASLLCTRRSAATVASLALNMLWPCRGHPLRDLPDFSEYREP